jgi:hypothetical protein
MQKEKQEKKIEHKDIRLNKKKDDEPKTEPVK